MNARSRFSQSNVFVFVSISSHKTDGDDRDEAGDAKLAAATTTTTTTIVTASVNYKIKTSLP